MSSKMPWFRAYTEMVDDEKLRLLAFEDRWHFVALLCLKGQGLIDEGGSLLMRKVAVKLGLSVVELGDVVSRLAAVELVDKETLQPSMHLVVERDELRPTASVWRVIRERIFVRDDYTCQYCGERGGRLECDHIFPVSRGGGHEDENLTTACRECNRSKRAKTVAEWKEGEV